MTEYTPAKTGKCPNDIPQYFQNCTCCNKYLNDNKSGKDSQFKYKTKKWDQRCQKLTRQSISNTKVLY